MIPGWDCDLYDDPVWGNSFVFWNRNKRWVKREISEEENGLRLRGKGIHFYTFIKGRTRAFV